MKGAVLLMKEASALQTDSVRCTMDSARRVRGCDHCMTSIGRGTTDTVRRMPCSVALMCDPMRHMMNPDRHLTDAMRSAMGCVRAVTRPRPFMRRATRQAMDTMRL